MSYIRLTNSFLSLSEGNMDDVMLGLSGTIVDNETCRKLGVALGIRGYDIDAAINKADKSCE